jgi:hypothetical protein
MNAYRNKLWQDRHVNDEFEKVQVMNSSHRSGNRTQSLRVLVTLLPLNVVAHVLPVYERRVECGRVYAGLEWVGGCLWLSIGWAAAGTGVHD